MDIPTDTNDKGRSYGYASNLKRFGASLADHNKYSRREFIATLADCRMQLGVEKRDDKSENQVDENGEEIEESATQIEWQSLECPKCHKKQGDTRILVQHLVHTHGKTEDKLWYREFGTLTADFKKYLDRAVRKQEETSFIKRRFDDSNNLLTCQVESPLAPFLMMRHIQVFCNELGNGATDGIGVNITIDEKNYYLIFGFQKLDKARRRVKRGLVRKAMEKKVKALEKDCLRVSIEEADIVLNKSRSEDDTTDLLQALNLPKTGSHEDIMRTVNAMKARYDEINNVYSKTVKADGQKMSAEEKRLISSLTNDMLAPVSGKRKTTYKNPSELAPMKKRQKTATPE